MFPDHYRTIETVKGDKSVNHTASRAFDRHRYIYSHQSTNGCRKPHA
jgi:hypothetical protein